MSRVNWSTAAQVAVKRAKSKGKEGNITQFRNALNDLALYLVDTYTSGEIIDGVNRLAFAQHRDSKKGCGCRGCIGNLPRTWRKMSNRRGKCSK